MYLSRESRHKKIPSLISPVRFFTELGFYERLWNAFSVVPVKVVRTIVSRGRVRKRSITSRLVSHTYPWKTGSSARWTIRRTRNTKRG